MRYLLGLCLVMMLTGCPLDGLFGVKENPDGTVEVDPKGGPAGVVATVAKEAGGGTPVGWVGFGLALIVAAYQGVRKGQAVAALVSTIAGVEVFIKTPEGAPVGKFLKTTLANKHSHDNVGPLMEKLVEANT